MVTEAQKKRRDHRRLKTYSKIGQALKWNIGQGDVDTGGMLVGDGHPGIAGIMAVRDALGGFDLGGELEARYAGMTRTSEHGAHGFGDEGEGDGIVRITASIRTPSGVKVHFDVPLVITAGRILPPSVLVHEGTPHILAQSTFDALVMPGTFHQPIPRRSTMYSPDEAEGAQESVVRPKTHLYTVARLGGKTADAEEYIDPAERECESFCVGSEKKLIEDCRVSDRGGRTYDLSKGFKVKILKDMSGDGSQYEVKDEDGDIFVIPGKSLTKQGSREVAPKRPFDRTAADPEEGGPMVVGGTPPSVEELQQQSEAIGGLQESIQQFEEGREPSPDEAPPMQPETADMSGVIGQDVSPDLKTVSGAFATAKLPLPLKFTFAEVGQAVETREGGQHAEVGDAIMTGTEGERWPIPRQTFEETYDVLEPGVAAKKDIPVHAKQMDEPFSVKPPWSDTALQGEAGDYLVQYGPGDYGTVGREIFGKTYKQGSREEVFGAPDERETALEAERHLLTRDDTVRAPPDRQDTSVNE